MKKKMIIRIVKFFLIVCFTMFLTSCAHLDKYSFENIGNSNYAFQSGNFTNITKTYEEAAKLKNRNYALWYSQLGSIYLTQGDYDKALDSFLIAHYLMNNITAFKQLERKAVSLTGSEDTKAYKGDPYEKAMNSLYVGLLLYNNGDLENAMAAFKTGILADSDSKSESYKSDIAVLYLLVSRIAKKLGNESLSNDYCSVTKGLYSSSDYSNLGFNDELIQKMLNLKNNVLLVVEFGEGPFKSRRGQYGELAVINGDRYDVNGLNIKIDGKTNSDYQVYSNTDVYFQASTRGGRKMDGILKGKATFKKNSASTSKVAINFSAQLLNQANQVSDPYARAGLAAAAGISALVSGGAAIMSRITNPKADIRYWTLLPEHIIIFPLFILPGKHKINVEFNDGRYSRSDTKANYEFDVDIQKDKDNIIFKRILNYQIPISSNGSTSKVNKPEGSSGMSYDIFSILVYKGMNFSKVEQFYGSPLEKSRDYLGREVWFYKSDKPGYSNIVYFTKGEVSEVGNTISSSPLAIVSSKASVTPTKSGLRSNVDKSVYKNKESMSPASYIQYKDKKYDFSIDYPADWSVSNSTTVSWVKRQIVVFTSPSVTAIGNKMLIQVVVAKKGLLHFIKSDDQLGEEYINELKKLGCSVLEKGNTQLLGRKTLFIIAREKINSSEYAKRKFYLVIGRKTIYGISYDIVEQEYDKYLGEAEKIISTFTIISEKPKDISATIYDIKQSELTKELSLTKENKEIEEIIKKARFKTPVEVKDILGEPISQIRSKKGQVRVEKYKIQEEVITINYDGKESAAVFAY